MRTRLDFGLSVALLLLGFLAPERLLAITTKNLTQLTPEQLAQILVGQGVTISNVKYKGDLLSAGSFSGGLGSGSNGIGIGDGVILTSGDVAIAAGPNNDTGATGAIPPGPGDPDLDLILKSQPGYTDETSHDATVLEFDFVPQQSRVAFQYVFASEEYNEWVGQFNDLFAFFVDGTNIALIPGTTTAVTINNVNKSTNSGDYLNNDLTDFPSGNTPYDTQYDGFTTVLTAQASVTPGVVHHIKLVIADTRDEILDSAVFLKSGSFVSSDDLTLLVPIVLSAAGLNNSFFTSELTLTNRGANSATVTYTYTAALGEGSGTATDNLPAGVQRIYPNAIEYLQSIGVPIPATGSRGGTLRISFTGLASSHDGAATVRTGTVVSNGRAGLAYNGVPVSDLLNGPAYLCGLRQNGTDRSNAAFINGGSSSEGSIRLKITVISGDPAAPASAETFVDLAPGGFQQLSGILGGYGISNGYVRVERVTGSAPFYAYAVINDQANSDGSFVPPILESSLVGVTALTLPVIVETSNFSSELILTNWSSATKKLLLQFVADGIQAADSTANTSVTLKPAQQVILPQIVQSWRSQGVAGLGATSGFFTGALFVTVEGGDVSGISVGARTAAPGGGGQYGLFYVSVPRGRAAQATAWVYGLQQNANNRTNFAFVNTGDASSSADVFRIELFNGDSGQKVNTVEGYTVNARGWKQIGAILSQYANGTSQGYARITRTTGNNPFIVYSVINDGGRPGERSDDGAFVSMEIGD